MHRLPLGDRKPIMAQLRTTAASIDDISDAFLLSPHATRNAIFQARSNVDQLHDALANTGMFPRWQDQALWGLKALSNDVLRDNVPS